MSLNLLPLAVRESHPVPLFHCSPALPMLGASSAASAHGCGPMDPPPHGTTSPGVETPRMGTACRRWDRSRWGPPGDVATCGDATALCPPPCAPTSSRSPLYATRRRGLCSLHVPALCGRSSSTQSRAAANGAIAAGTGPPPEREKLRCDALCPSGDLREPSPGRVAAGGGTFLQTPRFSRGLSAGGASSDGNSCGR